MSENPNSIFVLGYNLNYESLFDLYLPYGLIVKNTENGLGYLEKRATPQTILEFGIELCEKEKKLFDLVELLQHDKLLHRFNGTKKNKKTLEVLMQNTQAKEIISGFLQRQMLKFYELINEIKTPLAIDYDRKDVFTDHQIQYSSHHLQPLLDFEKVEDGMVYTLKLKKDKEQFHPFQKRIKTLLNEPAWVLINKILFRLEHINTNKLKPFLDKKSIQIPQKTLNVYFDKFIKDIVKKTDITARGFNLTTYENLDKVSIKTHYDFFSEKYLLVLDFNYDGIHFLSTETRKKHVSLNRENDENISVLETKRHFEKEKEYFNKLEVFGLKQVENGIFSFIFDEKLSKYANVEKLISCKDELIDLGFHWENFEVDNHQVVAYHGKISNTISEEYDWFDLKMMVECHEYQFPFTKLVEHLIAGNRFYQLPNQEYFLIPEEWFSLYQPIIDMGKMENESIKIKKNQYGLLAILDSKTFLKEPLNQGAIKSYFSFPNTIKATLRPYQMEGVQWLWQHYVKGMGACLADDMGLGKTLQTITLLESVKQNLPKIHEQNQFPTDLFSEIKSSEFASLQSLIVCPSSLIFNWQNEIEKFAPHFKVYIHNGKDRNKNQLHLENIDIIIVSYSILLRDSNLFKKHHFQYVVVDESQQIKNRDSKIFMLLSTLQVKQKISLSGTPIENSLSDLWSQMQFINPELLGTYTKFDKIFKTPIEKKHSETALQTLKELVNPFILRRTKEQVLQDLPPLTEQVFFTEMDEEQKSLYEKEKSKARNLLLGIEKTNTSRIKIFQTLMRLRQMSNHPKIIHENGIESGKFIDVTNYLSTLLKTDNKVLVFSFFVEHLNIYSQWCDENDIKYEKFTGGTSLENRKKAIKNFSENTDIQLFFMTTQSGGVGLNLTEASYVLILDPWWNPFKELQAVGRAHRIGQKKAVTLVKFIAKDSIEEKILTLQTHKKTLSEDIIGVDMIPKEVIEKLDFVLE